MEATNKDIENLSRLQEIDNILEDGAEAFNNSPIAIEIEKVREKKAKYKAKRDQLDAVYVKARDEIAQVSAKDSQLAEEQKKAQAEIEATQGDYRKVEAHTNKLNELTNQRKEVDAKLEEIEANFEKIKSLKAQIDDAIGKVSMKEDDLNRQLQDTNAQLKFDMEKAQGEKQTLEKEISMEALAEYKKARQIVGKIVISHLEDESCSVCKSKLTSGALSKVLEEAPLSCCPNCHRLLCIS